ncbi:AbrB/MazE/SpoVT family DNA-binding domain-containing protein [Thermodesulfovibrio sp. TK110]
METIIVGERGQVTIPKSLRKKYNIKAKQPVIIEDRDGEIVIKPVIVIPKKELEKYAREFSDEVLEQIIKENKLTPEEEQKIMNKWNKNA